MALSRSWGIAVVAMLVCGASLGGLCRAKEPASGPPLPGLVSAPRPLPGIGRWQLARKSPRGPIAAVAWNADGTEIAYSDHMYVRICDAQTLETKSILVGHTGPVTAIDWNHCTHRIASSSYDGTVRIWSAAGRLEKVLEPNAGGLKALSWTKDGAMLAAASSRGSVCLWNADGQSKKTLQVSKAPVNCLTWSPDNPRLVTGDDDGHVKLWTADGKPVRACDGHVTRVIAVAWSPDGKHFASATFGEQEPNTSREHTEARIYTADGSTAATIPSESGTWGLCFSTDSQRLAIYDSKRAVRICDLRGAELDRVQVRLARTTHPNGIAWAPKGERIALGSVGALMVKDLSNGSSHTSPLGPQVAQSLRPLPLATPDLDLERWLIHWPKTDTYEVWSASLGKRLATIPDSFENVARPVWSFSGDEIAYVERSNRLRVWPVGAPASRVVLEAEDPVEIIAWSPDGKCLATLDRSGNLRAVRTDGKVLLRKKFAPPVVFPENQMRDPISQVVFGPGGKSIAVVEVDAVQLVPLDGTAIKTFAFEKSNSGDWGASFWWSSDGLRMTTVRKEREARHILGWSLETGQRILIDKFGDELTSIDPSPDGKAVAIGYDTGFWQVRRLDDAAATPLESEPAVHLSTVRSIAFAPDGRRFATGGWEGWIKIWSSEGKLLETLHGNDWPVHLLTWSTDGRRLLSVGRDRTTHLWSLTTGRPLLRFETARDQQLTLITEDGRIVGPSTEHLDHEFWALIEKPTGEIEMISYADFLKRTGHH